MYYTHYDSHGGLSPTWTSSQGRQANSNSLGQPNRATGRIRAKVPHRSYRQKRSLEDVTAQHIQIMRKMQPSEGRDDSPPGTGLERERSLGTGRE